MRILSAAGAGMPCVMKWTAKAILGLLGLVLEMAKVILLLFGFAARTFLVFVRAGIP